MGERIEEVKRRLIQAFPKLKLDKKFKITSKSNPSYNCIAWAYHVDNSWMWPNTGEYEFLDGIHFWPSAEIMDCDVQNFIDAFKLKGYELCENSSFEVGYRKIAFYTQNGTSVCTHAARQLSDGNWTSKLGVYNDICHGTPEAIESDLYGKVFCYMKMKFE